MKMNKQTEMRWTRTSLSRSREYGPSLTAGLGPTESAELTKDNTSVNNDAKIHWPQR